VTVTTPEGHTIWSYAATSTPGQGLTAIADLPGSTLFNTGIGLFATHAYGYDAAGGRILITPL
jgi:hypothetical protein